MAKLQPKDPAWSVVKKVVKTILKKIGLGWIGPATEGAAKGAEAGGNYLFNGRTSSMRDRNSDILKEKPKVTVHGYLSTHLSNDQAA
jgi:hypothetical protein